MRIHVHGQADRFNGWGLHTLQVVRYLQARATVTFTHAFKDIFAGEDDLPYGTSQEGQDAILQVLPASSPVIEGSIVWTMHEASLLPFGWAHELNKARAVLVPTVWNARGFKMSGVECPIYIARLGYDPTVFRYGPRTHDGLVFGAGGSISMAGERKEVQKVIDAFHATDVHAKLVVKIFPWDVVDTRGDHRIEVIHEVWPNPQSMNDWYKSLDCFVTASRGEGFGLMPLQALVCGIDVIAPIYGGHCAYMTPDNVYPLPYVVGPARGAYNVGEQCFVNVSDISKAIINVATRHQEESKYQRLARTTAQARSVLHWTWKRAMDDVFSLVREI